MLDEDFNDGFPSEWEIINGGNSTDTWKWITDRSSNSLDGTPFMIVDSDEVMSAHFIEDMRTPIISGIPELPPEKSLILSFAHYYNNISTDKAEVMIFDGSSWTILRTYTTDQGSWTTPQEVTIDITQYINDNLQISFFYDDNDTWAWWWAVDNVKIEIVDAD